MRNVDNLDVFLLQCADNLPCDFRTFSLVRGREGFVKEDDALRGDIVNDPAHAAELFIEFSALQGRVLLPFEMREDTSTDVGTKRVCGHKHSTLHHQLRQSDAA